MGSTVRFKGERHFFAYGAMRSMDDVGLRKWYHDMADHYCIYNNGVVSDCIGAKGRSSSMHLYLLDLGLVHGVIGYGARLHESSRCCGFLSIRPDKFLGRAIDSAQYM